MVRSTSVITPVDVDLQRRLDRALRQEAALLALASVDHQAFEDRLRRILQVDAATLGVARVSFWSMVDAPAGIRCEALFLAEGKRFEHGLVLAAADFPRYFEALAGGKIIAAVDA